MKDLRKLVEELIRMNNAIAENIERREIEDKELERFPLNSSYVIHIFQDKMTRTEYFGNLESIDYKARTLTLTDVGIEIEKAIWPDWPVPVEYKHKKSDLVTIALKDITSIWGFSEEFGIISWNAYILKTQNKS